MADDGDLVLVGAIAGAFGVKGEVRVRSFTAAPENLVSYGALLDKSGAPLITPKRWRSIKDAIAVSAPEIATREQAEALKGQGLYVRRSRLPPAADDEFYHVDLIGCRVEALDGTALGEVIAAPNFGAGDLLEVRPPAGPSWFLPFTKAHTPLVDVAARRIVADPPVAEEP
ncbi:MAG: ribosome maturation factor RimM [Hyphomonadaceae bacterium]|nr:ribosome maturation factor RimM [Hyphomonadaceae bacterium]